ncbi:sorting nexin-11-like [Argonauta hians]
MDNIEETPETVDTASIVEPIETSKEHPPKSTDISVQNPKTHLDDNGNKYITYEINVKTTDLSYSLCNSRSRRRYSEFEWLRKQLEINHPDCKAPKLPRSLYFNERFDADCIAHRMKGLLRFLYECILIKDYVSDTTFHLFLQSDLTWEELIKHSKGNFKLCLDEIWKNEGRIHPKEPDFWELVGADIPAQHYN